MFGEDELVKLHKSRNDLIGTIILIAFACVIARLWYLQILKGEMFYQYSIENSLRKETIMAPRGLLFSRDNSLMVYNVPSFDAVVVPQYLKNKDETLALLGSLLGMEPAAVQKVLKKSQGQASYRPVTIKKNISREEVAKLETQYSQLPGVSVISLISREYVDGEVGSHLFGYISEINQTQLPNYRKRDNLDYKLGDFIGQSGLEEVMDLKLRGRDGYEFVEVDARGRSRRRITSDDLFADIENKIAVPGDNLRLTIDRDLQLAAYKALEGKVGAAVALDPKTGQILAMVSRPNYNAATFNRGVSSEYWREIITNKANPLRDRTIQEHYSPGSTFKPITAIAGLEAGLIDENTEVNCTGSFKLGSRVFHCWKEHGHGRVDIIKAIRESCDVFFYKLAARMDIDILAKYSFALGLGKRSGVPLTRETTGLIPTKAWKKKRTGVDWQLGETLSCVIGQSYVLTTPLQLALAYSTIVNGGKIYRPYIVSEIFNNAGEIKEKFTPEVLSDIHLSKKTMQLVERGLYEVVNERSGTAWAQRGSGIQMGAKTGTAQVVRFSADKIYSKCENNKYEFRHHALFVGFAPFEDPSIVVAVIAEHSCHGGSSAGPVAKDVITAYMKKYKPELHAKYIEQEKKSGAKSLFSTEGSVNEE